MSLEKEIIEDKIEVVGEYKAVQVRTATAIKEDGVELTRSFTRKVLQPNADISKESSEVQGICNAVWTDDIKTAYKAFIDSQPTRPDNVQANSVKERVNSLEARINHLENG